MRRLIWSAALAPLVLSACSQGQVFPEFGEDVEVSVGVDGTSCLLELETEQLVFDDGAVEPLVLINPCDFTQRASFILDDPAGAFVVTLAAEPVPESIDLTPNETVELEITLTAQDAGTYEAQLVIREELADAVIGSVELFAEVQP